MDKMMPSRRTDRKFMIQAIEAMRLSRSEHSNKADPLVGAVLVDRAGRVLARAYRGNFSVGEHAEFSVLEKIASHVDTAGLTLYTTLEPCTTRKPPKKPCAHRIVAKGIRRVFVGIPDPNPAIHGQGIDLLRRHDIEIQMFPPDLAEQICVENHEFIESFSRSTYVKSEAPAKPKAARTPTSEHFRGPSYEENRPISTTDLRDLSREAVEQYSKASGIKQTFASAALWRRFLQAGFLARVSDGKRLVPTLAGLVVFGNNPAIPLPQCKIKAQAFAGSPDEGGIPERAIGFAPADISGPLIHVIERIRRFFRRHVRKVPQIRGSKRVQTTEYPWEAVREAVVNALVHRDYQDGAHVFFQMFRDRIIVKSPGPPLPPLTMDKIKALEITAPLRRNPRVADAAHRLKYMDEWGTGIQAMIWRLKAHGLREPEFDFKDGFFIVTLYGRELTPISRRLKPEIIALLTERQRKILDIMSKQGRVTSSQATRQWGITRETATTDFNKLIELGIVERKGVGRSTYYVLRTT